MRTADIKVGEEYSIKQPYSDHPLQAIVLETSVEYKKWQSQGGLYQATIKNGIRVEYLNSYRIGKEEIVTPTRVLRPWTEQIEINEKVAEREARSEQAEYDRQQQRLEVTARANAYLPEDRQLNHRWDIETTRQGGHIRLTVEQLNSLLDQVAGPTEGSLTS